MRKILTIALLTFIVKAYSQTAHTTDFKKAKFTYLQKSNYEFDERGVYADSILFIKDFPGVKYSFTNSPKNKNLKTAFIPYSSLKEENLILLRALIYHTNILLETTYYKEKQKTETYCYYCHDDETKNIMTFLKSNCKNDKGFPLIKKYTKDSQVIIDNSVTKKTKDLSKSYVEFSDQSKTLGTYELETKDFVLTNIVEFKPELNKHITPIEIFNNVDYGVSKVFSTLYTIELTSVTYE